MIIKPKILILDAPQADDFPELAMLGTAGFHPKFLVREKGESPSPEILAETDIILTQSVNVDRRMIEMAERCMLIAHYGPGAGRGVARVDHRAARDAGIYIASSPSYAPESWANAAMAYLEMLERGLGPAKGRPLAEMRLGLVGLGQVGIRLARLAQARKMDVWACDPFTMKENFATESVKQAPLTELFGLADAVSIQVPLGPATQGMIDEQILRLLKKGAWLMNIGAPEVINLEHLADGLPWQKPAVACFDETLPDDLPAEHPLRHHDQLFSGKNLAFAAPGNSLACRRAMGQLLGLFLRGDRPPHLLLDPPCPRHILVMAHQAW